jgi:hypothetical protein
MGFHDPCKEYQVNRPFLASLLAAAAFFWSAPILAQQPDPFAPEMNESRKRTIHFHPRTLCRLPVLPQGPSLATRTDLRRRAGSAVLRPLTQGLT